MNSERASSARASGIGHHRGVTSGAELAELVRIARVLLDQSASDGTEAQKEPASHILEGTRE